MSTQHQIDRAISSLNTTMEGLGALLGVSKGAVSQWKLEERKVPIIHCVTIEKLTKGEVSRKDLRPDDWHEIWPELIDVA